MLRVTRLEHGDERDPVMNRSESEHAPAPRQWHRLFGIALTDLFSGTPWRVELEKELALQSQLLDVVIIEQAPARRRGDCLPACHGGAESLLHELYLRFKLELPDMAYTMADFLREHHQSVLNELSAEERAAFLQQLPVEERLRGLDTDELRRLLEELNKRLN